MVEHGEHVGAQVILGVQVFRVPFGLVRVAEPAEVEGYDVGFFGEGYDDMSPVVPETGPAVQEDDRLAASAPHVVQAHLPDPGAASMAPLRILWAPIKKPYSTTSRFPCTLSSGVNPSCSVSSCSCQSGALLSMLQQFKHQDSQLLRTPSGNCLKRGSAKATGVYLDLRARSKRADSAVLVPREATFRAPQGLFRQFQGEVRRTPLPRTWVNRARRRAEAATSPGPYA